MAEPEKEAQARREGKTIVRASPGAVTITGPNVVQVEPK